MSATQRCSRACWRRSGRRSYIRFAGATRRARRCCTRHSCSPRPAATARLNARSAASSASCRHRPVAGYRRARGWGAPARWRRTTRSVRPCSVCAERRCPTAPTTRRRSICSGSRSRPRAAVATSAKRRGHWRSWAVRCCCAASGLRRWRRSTNRSHSWARRAGWRSSPSRRRCGPRWRCARATLIAQSRCSITPSRSAAASATLVGRRWPLARGASSTRLRASAPRPWCGCATPPYAPCGSPILTSGCTRTAWRRWPASQSPTLRLMLMSAWPSSSGSPPAATCASSSCAPRCTVRGSAIPAAVEAARLLGEAIDNPALHAELAAAV